jgi:RHS repeat-associated protein
MFDSFGNRVSSDKTTDPHSYFGGQWDYYGDSQTGLELLGSPFYDPQTGRFITRDPIGAVGGANLYAYTGDNPMNAIDPSGTSIEWYGHIIGTGR